MVDCALNYYRDIQNQATEIAKQGDIAIVKYFGKKAEILRSIDASVFNADSSSQYLFKLLGCDDVKMDEFNAISDGKGGRGWSLCREYLFSHSIGAEFAR